MIEFMETSKVALLIVDKLLLGLLLLVFGLWANRALEKFKIDQSFYSEINKYKVAKIASVWEEFYALELLAWNHRLSLAIILWQEMKNKKVQGITPEVPRNDNEIISLVDLATKQPKEFHSVVNERSKAEAQPIRERAQKKAGETFLLLGAARFWIGDVLYNNYTEHYNSLHKVISNWAFMAKSGDLQNALKQINKTREHIDSALLSLKDRQCPTKLLQRSAKSGAR